MTLLVEERRMKCSPEVYRVLVYLMETVEALTSNEETFILLCGTE